MGKTIRINGVDVPVVDDELTGEEIKDLSGIPTERVLVRQEPDRNVIIPDNARIRIAGDEVFTHHAHHSKAAVATAGPRGARVRREAAQLAAAYPGVEVADDATWVLIPGFRLPAGWQPQQTTVLVVPPPSYPDAAPDGFYLGARLHRQAGGRLGQPGHYYARYHNLYAHLGYVWYCLEDRAGRWDPRHDSLVSFVEAIRTYLGTAD